MFFSKTLTKVKEVFEDSNESVAAKNARIDEIHESFYTEVDRLLAEARISHSLETDKQELISKKERLEKLGFGNTKEVHEAKEETKRLRELEIANNQKEQLVRAINYFSQKYPQYKFITEASVKKICEKYGLIYGDVSNYKGDVPEKNLEQIENFKIQDEDKCFINADWYKNHWGEKRYFRSPEFISCKEYKVLIGENNINKRMNFNSDSGSDLKQCPLEIAAPLKDFDTDKMEVKDFKLQRIEDKDPVVLQPVYFEGTKHFLIITCWGQEASDELVVNERMN